MRQTGRDVGEKYKQTGRGALAVKLRACYERAGLARFPAYFRQPGLSLALSGSGAAALTEMLLDLVPVYGTALVFWSTLLGCFGVPAPATVSLLAAGAFVATGEMKLLPVVLAGLAGGLIGDQLGYWIGVRGGRWSERLTLRPRTAERLDRAKAISTRWGGFGVFMTRWALSPIGPVVNVLSGMAGMGWTRFTLYTIAGKIVWVGLFVGLGLVFSHSVAEIAESSGILAWILVIAAVAVTVLPLIPGSHRR